MERPTVEQIEERQALLGVATDWIRHESNKVRGGDIEAAADILLGLIDKEYEAMRKLKRALHEDAKAVQP